MKLEGGFGYQGALLMDGKTENLQCGLCGDWVIGLPHHLRREHSMSASAYKEKVGLMQNTALISEKTRELMVRNGLSMERRKSNLIPGGGGMTEAARLKMKRSRSKKRREFQNIMGTCPDQLIDRLRKLKEKLGRTPKQGECTFEGTLVRTFGSWKEAVFRAGIDYHVPGKNRRYNRTNEMLLRELAIFCETNQRRPTRSDATRKIFPYQDTYRHRFGSMAKAAKKVLSSELYAKCFSKRYVTK